METDKIILKMWNLRRYRLRAEYKDRKYQGGELIWKVKLREEILHELRNQTRDLKRRGLSNREGIDNRRRRRWKESQPKVLFSCSVFDLVA